MQLGRDEVGQSVLAGMIQRMGIDREEEIIGCQADVRGMNAEICLWFKEEVAYEKIEIHKGLCMTSIRTVGKPEVVVVVSNLHFSTPDGLIMNYIEHFGGKIVSKKVIYEEFKDGVMGSCRNGDRKYLVNFSKATHIMGTFHT